MKPRVYSVGITPIFVVKLNYCFSLQTVLVAFLLALAQPAQTKSRGIAPAALIPINEGSGSSVWLAVHAGLPRTPLEQRALVADTAAPGDE